jgi:hypothetical protein
LRNFLKKIWNFLKKIWDFLNFCPCLSTLDLRKRFEELPEKDLELPGFLFLPFNSGSPGKI